MTARRTGALVACILHTCAALGGCSTARPDEAIRGTAVDHGAAIFSDPRASSSASNPFSCASCHPRTVGSSDRIYPGAPLAGVTRRSELWGGARRDLLESINDCRMFFMDARTPWTSDDGDARALYALLDSLDGDATPFPFTIVRNPEDLSPTDATRGADLYRRACAHCHGDLHAPAGASVATFVPTLPDAVRTTHAELSAVDLRRVFIQKIRAGAFGGDGAGSMPPFSREQLSDDDIAAILAALGL